MFELYKAIWRISARRQVVLIFISISVAALAAAPLEFQKRIVNGLEGRDIDVAQLVTLCLGMLGVICISLLLKWLLGVMSSILGEDMIRRIRTALLGGAVQQDGTRVRGGTLATTVAAEAEELGKFTGGAFSEPVVQVGTLLSVIGYIAATQPVLGVIAVCMLIPQVLLVLVTQRKVNELVAERVRLLRGATDEMVSKSIKDAEQAALDAFDKIYSTRKSMFIWKLSTKFVLSLINGIGTVSVLLLGGFMS